MNGLSKFLIDANDPRYSLYDLTDGDETVHQLTWPEGRWEKNEISDTLYVDGAKVPYHEHRSGIELFLVARGHVIATIRAQRTCVPEGSMILIQPYTGHGFEYYDDGKGMIWRECFQEINMSGGIANKCRIKDNYGEALYFEPEFRKRYLANNNDIAREMMPLARDVDAGSLYEIRLPDFAYAEYAFGKLRLQQKVARFETHGVKEVWKLSAGKGVKLEWDDPFGASQVFLVCKGRTHWRVLDEEFEAGADCFIKVPPYAKHAFEVLEDGTELIDYGCSCYLGDMLEDYMTILANDPSRFDTVESRRRFIHNFNCFLTRADFGDETSVSSL